MKSSQNEITNVLVEDIDEKVLELMPEWLKILRDAYQKVEDRFSHLNYC